MTYLLWGLPNPPPAGPSLDLFGAEVKRDYLCTNSDCCLQWNQQKCCLQWAPKRRSGRHGHHKNSWMNRSGSIFPRDKTWDAFLSAHGPIIRPKISAQVGCLFVDSKNRNSERLSDYQFPPIIFDSSAPKSCSTHQPSSFSLKNLSQFQHIYIMMFVKKETLLLSLRAILINHHHFQRVTVSVSTNCYHILLLITIIYYKIPLLSTIDWYFIVYTYC